MNPNDQYICALHGPTDPKPKMIRITMTLDDPSGTLPRRRNVPICLHAALKIAILYRWAARKVNQ